MGVFFIILGIFVLLGAIGGFKKRRGRAIGLGIFGIIMLFSGIGLTAGPGSSSTSPGGTSVPTSNTTDNSAASVTTSSADSNVSAPSQPSTPATWQTVATWTGDSIQNTQPFTVGDNWRIVWASAPGKSGDGNFSIDVKQSGNDGPLDMLANVIGKGGATNTENLGAGTYYLNIQGDENYKVMVQTQVSNLPAQPKNTWTTIAKLSGDSIQTYPSFTVNNPWRIVWTSAPGSIGDGNFVVDVQQPGSTLPVSTLANVMGKDSGVDYEYSSGSFNLSVQADENYTIEIQKAN